MSETPSVEIPKTMLILKSHATAIATVETFLRNRGWKIFSTANLKEALVQIVQQKPSYVLISVDHTNKKVRTLPKLLSQAFPVATIVFAENQTSSSFKLLNEAATEYRVYPPVTGPAIERCVNKYLKDQQTKLTLQSANDSVRADGQKPDNGGMISIKGGSSENISIKGDNNFGDDGASRLLAQFLNEDSAGAVAPGTMSGNSKNDSGLIFAQPADDDEGAGSQNSLQASGQTYVQKGSAGPNANYVPPNDSLNGWGQQQNSQGSGKGMASQQGPGAETNSAAGTAADDAGAKQARRTGTAHDGMGSREYRRSQAAPQWAPITEPQDRLQHVKDRQARSNSNDTLIARGTQKSLEESSDIGDGVVKVKLQDTTSAACIMVESERFSGYLVAVMGKNKPIDAKFIETIKGRLFSFLKNNGEDVSDNDCMDIKIKQVDFEPWALEYADFLRKSVHQGNEVAMAFFPRRPLKAILQDSHHHDMAKIDMNDLQGDRPVEFDLYVYLPTNNKYVLYTPKGGVFYNKQMDRLKNQGVTHMHVQRDAVQAIAKYQAQNYLNDMVDDYDQKQAVLNKIKAS